MFDLKRILNRIAWIALAVAAVPAAAAVVQPDILFETTIPAYLASGRFLAVDESGGAVAGGRFIGDRNENNILVARTDAAGQVLWTFTVEGYDHDVLGGLVLDGQGDVYLSGWTDSEDFPLVGFDTPPTGFRDAFLMKLDGQDGEILFSRLIGGEYTDMGYGLALAPDGGVVVVGSTISRDFPVVDPIQAELNSYPYASSDAFVTRLTADGGTILFSTFLGGSTDDAAHDVAIDGQGRIVLSGSTLSADFPTVAPLQGASGGGNDVFVARLDVAATQLEFSTYLGGADTDRPGGLAVDGADAIYVSGVTGSADFPTTTGSFQDTFVGAINGCSVPFGGTYNCSDGFLAKLAADGGSLAYGTYLGGTGVDEVRDVVVDRRGRARLAGYTFSADFPENPESSGVFVLELSADGVEPTSAFFTFSGSSNQGHAVGIGPDGDTYLTCGMNVPSELYLARLSTPGILSGVDDTPPARTGSGLQAAPNPFNPSTQLAFRLDRAQNVELAIYDSSGRKTAVVADGFHGPGRHEVHWHGQDETGGRVASGVYFARLQTEDGLETRKMALIK